MTPEQFIESLEQLETALLTEIPKLNTALAINAKALIQNRIQKTGKNADETQFSPYSPEYEKKKAKIKGPVPFVDLTLSGDMWESIGVINEGSESQGVFFTTVGGRDTETQKKMQGNATKRGDFLRVSEKEEEVLAKVFDDEYQNIIDQYLPPRK